MRLIAAYQIFSNFRDLESLKSKNTIVRLKDVAEHAGVSEAAASYALRGKPGVSKVTIERVIESARLLGYQRNPLISSLMEELRRNRSVTYQGTLAFCHFLKNDSELVDDKMFMGKLFRGVVERSSEYGYRVDPIPAQMLHDNPVRFRQILRARSIEGIFIGPLTSLDQKIALNWGNRAAVALGYTYVPDSITRIATDNFNGIRLALEKVAARGYQRPALVFNSSDLDARSNYGFTAGLSTFCRLNHLEEIPIFIAGVKGNPLRAWLEMWKPDVVFAVDEDPALIEAVAVNGALICLIGDEIKNGIPCLAQRPHLLGAVGADELCMMLTRNQRGIPEVSRRIIVPLELSGFD
ncbi:LacI family DNA-binding transcriptional regulator [Coraliomargarita sp. W4R53]